MLSLIIRNWYVVYWFMKGEGIGSILLEKFDYFVFDVSVIY